jgi:bifunctional non-homologous end joining protein LigD
MRSPHHARLAVLESLALNDGHCMSPDTFDDGHALYQAVCEHGLEGVVAKRSASTYRPGQRGWVKVEEPRLLAARPGVRVAKAVARSSRSGCVISAGRS